MGLFGSIMNIISNSVAKSVSDVVSNAVAEKVKPAATEFAKKQADLIDSVTNNIEDVNDSYLRQNTRQAAEEIEKTELELSPTDEEVMAQWETLLSDYPKWNCGGKDFEFEKTTYGLHEAPCICFSLDGCEAYTLAYQTVLVSNGFLPKWPKSSSNQTWYKQIGSRYAAVFIDDMEDGYTRIAFYDEDEKEIAKAR